MSLALISLNGRYLSYSMYLPIVPTLHNLTQNRCTASVFCTYLFLIVYFRANVLHLSVVSTLQGYTTYEVNLSAVSLPNIYKTDARYCICFLYPFLLSVIFIASGAQNVCIVFVCCVSSRQCTEHMYRIASVTCVSPLWISLWTSSLRTNSLGDQKFFEPVIRDKIVLKSIVCK